MLTTECLTVHQIHNQTQLHLTPNFKKLSKFLLFECFSQAFRSELQPYVKEFIRIIQPRFKIFLLVLSSFESLQQSALCIKKIIIVENGKSGT